MKELAQFTDGLLKREKEILEYLDVNSPIGETARLLSDMMRGLSITPGLEPPSTADTFKKVFFSRPLCNMGYTNLIGSRKLARLMIGSGDTVETYARLSLDPRVAYGELKFSSHKDSKVPPKYRRPIKSRLISDNMPFVPILGNSLLNLSGWSDQMLQAYTSAPGYEGESVSWSNSSNRVLKPWDASMTFRNVMNEPVALIIDTWLEYQSNLQRSLAMPYYDHLLGRRVDYQTGIWTFVLLEDNRTISHYAKTIAFPTSFPSGKVFNYTKNGNVKAESTELNTQWRCIGAEYDDPMILRDFNKLVSIYNPDLAGRLNGVGSTPREWVELPPSLFQMFRSIALPYVDLAYKKLEWVVRRSDFEVIKKEANTILQKL